MIEEFISFDVASESVIKPCIQNKIIHWWIKYANYVITLCVDIRKSVAFSKAEIAMF